MVGASTRPSHATEFTAPGAVVLMASWKSLSRPGCKALPATVRWLPGSRCTILIQKAASQAGDTLDEAREKEYLFLRCFFLGAISFAGCGRFRPQMG